MHRSQIPWLYLGIEFADRLLCLLNLVCQELDYYFCRGNNRVVSRQRLGRTNTFDEFVLLLFVADGVVTQSEKAVKRPEGVIRYATLATATNDYCAGL